MFNRYYEEMERQRAHELKKQQKEEMRKKRLSPTCVLMFIVYTSDVFIIHLQRKRRTDFTIEETNGRSEREGRGVCTD